MPEISIIVPVYKVEDYLHRCVDSILAQTFIDYELILVDDGSPDRCGVICDDYAMKDIRIRVIHQGNQGQAAARNHGVNIAKGKLVCFVDADDAIHPEMIERLFIALNGSTKSISVCSAIESIIIDEFLKEKEDIIQSKTYFPVENELLSLYDDPYICWVVWGKLIPLDIVKKYPFENGRVYEDNAVVIKWLYEADSFHIITKSLYYYQINPNGTTKSLETEKRIVDWLWSRDHLLHFFKDNCLNDLYIKCLSKMFIVGAHKYFDTLQNNKKLSSFIKKQMKIRWKKYKNYVVFDSNNHSYVYAMLFPTEAKIATIAQKMLKKG